MHKLVGGVLLEPRLVPYSCPRAGCRAMQKQPAVRLADLDPGVGKRRCLASTVAPLPPDVPYTLREKGCGCRTWTPVVVGMERRGAHLYSGPAL